MGLAMMGRSSGRYRFRRMLDGARPDRVRQAVRHAVHGHRREPARSATPETDQESGADEDKHPDRGMLGRLPHPPAIMREDGEQDESAKQDQIKAARLSVGVEIHGSPRV